MDHLLELVGKQPEAQAMGGCLFSETEKGSVAYLYDKKTGRGWLEDHQKSHRMHVWYIFIFTYRTYI